MQDVKPSMGSSLSYSMGMCPAADYQYERYAQRTVHNISFGFQLSAIFNSLMGNIDAGLRNLTVLANLNHLRPPWPTHR
jgi:hypothetical protein